MQLRQDLGREDGWRNGFRQPRWQDSFHGRRQLVRHPGGRGAPGNEVAFLVTSGANFCGYGSGAEFAGGESFAQRPEGGPPQGALLLAQSLREWILEEGRTRARGKECQSLSGTSASTGQILG